MSICDCEEQWFGEDCENKHCPDWVKPDSPDALSPPDCTGHGMCVQGTCFCAAGWGLTVGSAGANVCKDGVCPVDCGPHGMCNLNACVCQDGWKGPACREPDCADDCSGHGTCTFMTANSPAECICEYGFSPPNCESVALYSKLKHCLNDCSGNGLCMDGLCVCMSGFIGHDCSGVVCSPGFSGPSCQYHSCPNDCSGYGVCFNGECACDNDHLAMDCSIPKKCYDACHTVCLPDLSGSRCEFCKGQCLTLASNPVVGNHNPMLARLYSFPQVSASIPGAMSRKHAQTPSKVKVAHHKRRHHKDTVSAVQTGNHMPTTKRRHTEVSTVKVGHYYDPSLLSV